MTEAEFSALAARGFNRIPLVLETFADLDTPLSLYIKLANQRYTFLLESVVGGERFGRYSFIGDFLRRYRAAPRPGLPRFCGGLAGYFGYDTVRHIETKLADSAPPAAPELADIPDILLMLTEELAVVDNLSGKISLIVYADPAAPRAYRTAYDRLHALRRKLREPVSIPYQTASELTHAESEFGAEGYKAAVARSREYIAAGDIMQVVIAQRTRRPFSAPPPCLDEIASLRRKRARR